MATGKLLPVVGRQGRWGGSCVLQVRDDALAYDGVRRGDYLVVDRGAIPSDDDALVVIRNDGTSGGLRPAEKGTEKGKPGSVGEESERLLLRRCERFGSRVRLQPGSSPFRPLLVAPDAAGIWGTVVAVMRKFDAA